MTIGTFIFFTALVAVLTWWLARGAELNLSTEQLIGLNGSSFNEGLPVMCWEVVAGFSLVVLGKCQ